ncbi:MAG TPA: CusA/CzcA family heavy metal efflux RND transporter [Deltaproteobacteria bacterium]|jgi:cobalt-zinc-cadmium resistance protein CzcA|nr:CusA/CzcA family heavy metal efflux RND transporter [Deltaproteobacteria bacterium]
MELALGERIVVIGAAVLLLIAGIASFTQLDIEAYPDPVQPMTEVLTLPTGLSAEEVEKLVTVPTEYGMSGMLHLKSMESISLYGLSDIRLYFDWDSDYEFDRIQTINQLQFVTLPQGITPGLSPENPIGEIYRYTVQGPDHDLVREKEVEDWICEKQFKTVPGVLDVSGFGGLTKEYHVEVDPQKLNHYAIPLSQVISAVQNSNTNSGGSYLNVGEQAFDVRGLGLIQNVDDIRDIVLAANKSTPIRIRDIGDASIGWAPRLGIVGMNYQDEVVSGIVLMRKYGNTLRTLEGVEAKAKELNTSGIMPKGYKVVPYYDRSGLVYTTLRTVLENLSLGMLLVFLVLIFFLGNLRTAIIAAINIPLAMFGAFILLYLTGTPANLLSLGAVDFGIIIDSTIIVVENIYRHLTIEDLPGSTLDCIRRASTEVGGPMFYSTIIFLIAFLPLFTMKGVEGAIFSPMSHTYAYALTVAIILAVMLSPVLSSYLLHKGIKETHNFVWEGLHNFYHRLFVRVLRAPRLTVAVIGLVMAGGLAMFPFLGGEFLPKLEEGNIWAHAIMPTTMNLPTGAKLVSQMRAVFLSFPEVSSGVSQLGRPDDGTETTSFFSVEFSVDLKPEDEWPAGMTKARLVKEIDEKLREKFPGVSFAYSQNIEDNIDEALSGVKAGENAVKVFGYDLQSDQAIATKVEGILKAVPGVTDVFMFKSLGQPNIVVAPDRSVAARYGLNSGDVSAVVQAAIGGQVATQVLEQDRSFPLVVRWKPEYRQTVEAMRNIRVNVPTGGNVPLGQIARVEASEGASFIYRGGLQRYIPVRFSVRGRDLKGAVAEAKARVAGEVQLPEGTHLEWVGEYGELQAANRRLAIVVPVALLMIMGVLYAATLSIVNTLILMAQVPLACLGGILGLVVTGTPFSVSAAVGFISIFAISIMDGILLNFYIRQLYQEGNSVFDSVVKGADRRFRAVMMTALVDGLGLLPAALSTRIGAQTQRPLAIVVIGGAISIALLTRVFQPTLVYLLHKQLGLTEERAPIRESS